MRIIADKKALYIHEAFAGLDGVRTIAAEEMSAENVSDAEALVVRSVTRVGAELLHGTAVRMVATASIGTDHVDHDYLAREGIALVSAAGGNANAVAEYVMAAVLEWLVAGGKSLADATLGVVGVGNIGSRVVRMARGLGMAVLMNDPPLAEAGGAGEFSDLKEILQADIITLHVPLHDHSRYGTSGLIGAEALDAMKPDALLINTSRGGVVDETALKSALASGSGLNAVIDVWRGEPGIDTELLQAAFLATPHIAGHSLEGKANCTHKVYEAVCRHFGIAPTWRPDHSLPAVDGSDISVAGETASDEEKLLQVIRQACDVRSDDESLRSVARTPGKTMAELFQGLRDRYKIRREFRHYRVRIGGGADSLRTRLSVLGFAVK